MKKKTTRKKRVAPATIGNKNEHRCIKYILDRYYIYGVPPNRSYHDAKGKLQLKSSNVHKVTMFGDMFCVEYEDDFGNKKLAGWDIITIPDRDEVVTSTGKVKVFVYLIQSKTNFKLLKNAKYIMALAKLKVPSFVKKQIFNWVDGKDEPEIYNL